MSAQFTFVSVELNEKRIIPGRRGQGIAQKDRSKIRSLAATSAWNRPLPGEDEASWRKRKAKTQALKRSKKSGFEEPRIVKIKNPEQSPSWDSSSGDSGGQCLTDYDSSEYDFDYSLNTPGVQEHYAIDNGFEEYVDQPGENLLTETNAPELSVPAKIYSDRIDPFWTFSIPYRPFMSAVINHRVTMLAPIDPELDKEKGQHATLDLFTTFMHDPCFLFASALHTAAHLYESGLQSTWTRSRYATVTRADILWLKGCSVSTVNQYLSNNDRTKSQTDACMAAVMGLAIFEKCYGDTRAYEAHMQGCQHLMDLRGGIMGMHPLLARHLKFMAKRSAKFIESNPDSICSKHQPKWSKVASRIIDAPPRQIALSDGSFRSETVLNTSRAH